MRISDWSSDVCSSDLRKVSPIAAGSGLLLRRGGLGGRGGRFRAGRGDLRRAAEPGDRLDRIFELEVLDAFLFEILGGRRKARLVLGVLGQDRVVGLDTVDPVAAQDVLANEQIGRETRGGSGG